MSLHLDAAQRARRKTPRNIRSLTPEQAAKACGDAAQLARAAADNVADVWSQLEQIGALSEAVRYARRNGIELPPANVIEATRALKVYAGAILLYAGSLRSIDRRVAYESSVGNTDPVVAS